MFSFGWHLLCMAFRYLDVYADLGGYGLAFFCLHTGQAAARRTAVRWMRMGRHDQFLDRKGGTAGFSHPVHRPQVVGGTDVPTHHIHIHNILGASRDDQYVLFMVCSCAYRQAVIGFRTWGSCEKQMQRTVCAKGGIARWRHGLKRLRSASRCAFSEEGCWHLPRFCLTQCECPCPPAMG